MYHRRIGAASATSLLPALLQTRLRLTRGRCVLCGHHFLRCFSHPSLQDFVAPQPRRPSFRAFPLHVEIASLLRLRVLFDLVHAKKTQQREPTVGSHARRSTNNYQPWRGPLLKNASSHTLQSSRSMSSRLSRSGHHRNHPKANHPSTVASMPTTFSSRWCSSTSCPCRPCPGSCRSRWAQTSRFSSSLATTRVT